MRTISRSYMRRGAMRIVSTLLALGLMNMGAVQAVIYLNNCHRGSPDPGYVDKSGCQTSTPNDQGVASCYGSCFKWKSDTLLYACENHENYSCELTYGGLVQKKYAGTCSGNTTTGGAGCDCGNYDSVESGTRTVPNQPIGTTPTSQACPD